MTTHRSNGEDTLAVYVAPHAPPAPARAARARDDDDGERVAISDPRSTATVELRALPLRPGPRNPDQRTLRPRGPRVELPDRRPLTRAQIVIIPPELIARWRGERAGGGTT